MLVNLLQTSASRKLGMLDRSTLALDLFNEFCWCMGDAMREAFEVLI